MGDRDISLTDAEWSVMDCLWEHAPLSGREASEMLAASCGWSRSTVLTLLRRLENKGAVKSGLTDGVKTFSPAICRDDAMEQATEGFLERVYSGSLGLMVSSFAKKRPLSRDEIDELCALLRGMEADGDDS